MVEYVASTHLAKDYNIAEIDFTLFCLNVTSRHIRGRGPDTYRHGYQCLISLRRYQECSTNK